MTPPKHDPKLLTPPNPIRESIITPTPELIPTYIPYKPSAPSHSSQHTICVTTARAPTPGPPYKSSLQRLERARAPSSSTQHTSTLRNWTRPQCPLRRTPLDTNRHTTSLMKCESVDPYQYNNTETRRKRRPHDSYSPAPPATNCAKSLMSCNNTRHSVRSYRTARARPTTHTYPTTPILHRRTKEKQV
jgi:hypothetical protein